MSITENQTSSEESPTKYKELSVETRLNIAEGILLDIFKMNILPTSQARGNLYRYHKRFFKNSPKYKSDESFGNIETEDRPFN